MNDKEISIGTYVTYPKTGTTGKVISTKEINGEIFFQVDKTGLFYRSDLLLPVIYREERKEKPEEDIRKRLENEKKLTSEEIEEAFEDVSGVGAG